MNLAEPNRDVGTRTEGVPNINIWAPYFTIAKTKTLALPLSLSLLLNIRSVLRADHMDNTFCS